MKSVLAVAAVLLSFGYFTYRVVYLLRLLTIGKAENRFAQPTRRLWTTIKQSILQFSQFRVPVGDYTYAGIMHILIIFGFLILLPGEIEFILGGIIPDFDFSFLGYPFFNLFLLSQDVFIFAVILAMVMAFFRRFILRPPQINYHLTAYLILTLICLLMITLLGMNSLRLVNPEEARFASVAGDWMPLTNLFVTTTGIHDFNHTLFEIMWWVHLFVLLFFLDYIPNSKHLHVFAAVPANFFRHYPPPLISLPTIDFDAEELDVLGVSKVEDLSWKQLFDGYTCTECGRCMDQCPANSTGKDLSPREIILSIKENLLTNGPKLLASPKEQWSEIERVRLIGDSITEDELWQCTTCGACANVCPVGNEHLRDIIEMRRYLMMEKGKAPELAGRAIKSLEARGHPFFGTGAGKKDWRKGLDVPSFEKGKSEYLLWIGCSITYEERAQKIARAMVGILRKAGISFGILEDGRCTGDPAKQMGNEFLFNELALQNIEEFSALGVEKIITMCPHCYHSFTHYYPGLGGTYEVIPHAIMIQRLMEAQKLEVNNGLGKITFHDPCYLARHNDILAEPRSVISKVGELTEMPRNGKASFCCGGGGGNYWAEEEGTRINRARAEEALETGADLIATACPFCLLMMTDGLKGFTEEEKAYDIAEIIHGQMPNQG
jgi:Fe-S oxidoreductase